MVVVSNEDFELLRSLDLTENQARVYLALLDFPVVGAGPLAKAALVPRNRLYEVLEELNGLGLVDIILEDPRKYKARPLEGYLDARLHSLEERIQQIQSSRSYAEHALQPKPVVATEEAGTTQVLMGRSAVAQNIGRMLHSAKRSLIIVASAGSASRLERHVLAATPGDNILLHLLLPAEAAAASRLRERYPGAVHPVVIGQLGSILVISDEREMLLVHPMPDDDHLTQGRDFAILSDNPVFVRDFVALSRVARAQTAPWARS